MEQSSEESTSSDESEQNGYERNAPIKEILPIPAEDQKSLGGIQSESDDFISKDKSGWAHQNEKVENLKEIERGRAKSVGRYVRKSSKVSPEKLKRSQSMDRSRSEWEAEKISREKSESSEREEKLMTDKERIRAQLGLKPKYSFEEKYEAKIKERKRKSRSRTRSRERKSHHGQQSRREELPKFRERRYQSHSKWRGETRDRNQDYYDDNRHGERRQESRDHRLFGEQNHVKPKKEIPCKYFNDTGLCKYISGHLGKFGNPNLHICVACFHDRGEKKPHSQLECSVVDESCMYYNNYGNCKYKSGHLSLDGRYARYHICKICFNHGEKRIHPAIDHYTATKRRRDSPARERFGSTGQKKPRSFRDHKRYDEKPSRFSGQERYGEKPCNFSDHERHDEKPCSSFNKDHTQDQEECRVEKKLLQEVQSESQLNRKQKDVIRKKDIKERMPTPCINEANFTPNVKKTFKTVNLGEGKLKVKTSEVAKGNDMVSPYNQTTHVEQAINQTKSNIDEVVEQEIVLKAKDASRQGRDPRRRNFNKTEQETSNSTEFYEEKLDSNMTRTILKDKEQSKENETSANASIHEQDQPLIEKNLFCQKADNKSTNKDVKRTKISLECYKKRRKLERSTPQAVIRLTDTSEGCGNSQEINEEKEKPREEGLVPVEDVLRNSNSNVDSETENNESEILKKLEHLQKLHIIEVENLRKVRQEKAEVNKQT